MDLSKLEKRAVFNYPNEMSIKPLLSVNVVTYNHDKYISKCLDNILNQKTNFPFEVLIGEDDSTDNTRENCINYAKKYPKKIRLFLHHRENVIHIYGNPTGRFNMLYNIKHSQGKYIAMCEGDDYWIDPYKLQKQVDFLEANDNFSLTCHDAETVTTNNKPINHTFKPLTEKEAYGIEDIIAKNFIPTNSVVFRRDLLELPEWFNTMPAGDIVIYYLLAKKGCIKYFPEKMSAYRIHDGGIWAGGTSQSRAEKDLFIFNELLRYESDEKIKQLLKTTYIKKAFKLLRYYSNKQKINEVDKVLNNLEKTYMEKVVLKCLKSIYHENYTSQKNYEELLHSVKASNLYKLGRFIDKIKKTFKSK